VSAPRRTVSAEEKRATDIREFEIDGSTFHFTAKDKDNLFSGGKAHFEWGDDEVLEVTMPPFEDDEARKHIVRRLLDFVARLLDTNDLDASAEFPRSVIPIRAVSPPISNITMKSGVHEVYLPNSRHVRLCLDSDNGSTLEKGNEGLAYNFIYLAGCVDAQEPKKYTNTTSAKMKDIC
jgi:hypothetical protein